MRAAFAPVLALACVLPAACAAPSSPPAPRASAPPPPSAPALASASASAPAPEPPPPEPPHVTAEAAERAMFLGKPPEAAIACRAKTVRSERIRCQLEVLYAADPQARTLAVDLYDKTGSVAGQEVDHVMDGGYRGMLHIVPELPVGKDRRHLEWVSKAQIGFEGFLAELRKRGPIRARQGSNPEAHRAEGAIRYRTGAVVFKFMRSVKARTPSAYAQSWAIGWNLSGSLHGSAAAVEETLWHEIFHLDDQEHGSWSFQALSKIYEGIYAKCKERTPCLAPFAPNETMVRGGTYYAFHGNNGPGEYAAELAVRYWREHRAILDGKPLAKKAFKCGPKENADAWSAIAAEFFGGVDLVPACGAKPP